MDLKHLGNRNFALAKMHVIDVQFMHRRLIRELPRGLPPATTTRSFISGFCISSKT